ncbi:ABC transporter ATP-binding protein [Blastococcus sp. TF02A-26]|uniref:ABC transporter ATP-binding protein n=1 Tax=Blastococcus sp. TF02A-26 TaxID=2250577 RepID=UPI000DEB54AB|nr:ABC transporter ATP-binding protein [Blastococcus sp. TF02A-26]RBY86814.1 ABC transporter ATP-binding protein [Blastococcus sp. TF02A-26]
MATRTSPTPTPTLPAAVPAPLPPPPSDDACIRVRGVSRSFPGRGSDVLVLDGVDLTVPQGSFVTLFGPSGCGKTTLLRILAGLQTQDEGEVRLFGQTPGQAAKDKNIAWIPQSSALLPWAGARRNADLSRRVNRRAGRRDADRRAPGDPVAVLGEMGLAGSVDLLPHQLSGGMRQRVSLARGFVQSAPLMLMDEPFSALDELTREGLRYQLLDTWERHRRTVVFVTHSATEAVLLSDTVVVMSARPGRISTVIDVDLPRPRPAGIDASPEFHRTVARLRAAVDAGRTA